MTFGWQRFRFDHPDDWAPVSISGSMREGYARLTGPGDRAIQVRWKHDKRPDASAMLGRYLASLRKKNIESESEEIGDGELHYRWKGLGQGRGAVVYADARLFFLEACGSTKSQLLTLFRSLRESFQAPSGSWAVLGLHMDLPERFTLEKHAFHTARTMLGFRPGLSCTRWGLAEQLLRDRPLVDWARATLKMPAATPNFEPEGLRLLGKEEGLVRLDPDQNQIVTVVSRKVKPEWAWLA